MSGWRLGLGPRLGLELAIHIGVLFAPKELDKLGLLKCTSYRNVHAWSKKK